MNRLLLVEDDELVGTMVSMNLEGEGYQVEWQTNGTAALQVALDGHFDLILLDISLPGMNGTEILHELRAAGRATPVLMLTAQHDVRSKVNALDLGADDYLPKPFDLEEMFARVRALVRRSQAERQIPSERVIRFGAYEVDLDTRRAVTELGDVELPEKETELLALLVKADGRPVSRADILDEVWGMDAFPTSRTVDNYIMRLRRYFEADPADPKHILTIRGTGYRFVP